MAEKVFKCGVKKQKGYLYFVDKSGNVARFKPGESTREVVCKNDSGFHREREWIYFVDKQGDVSRAKKKSFREFVVVKEEGQDQLYVERFNS